jgi:hypothetical protein
MKLLTHFSKRRARNFSGRRFRQLRDDADGIERPMSRQMMTDITRQMLPRRIWYDKERERLSGFRMGDGTGTALVYARDRSDLGFYFGQADARSPDLQKGSCSTFDPEKTVSVLSCEVTGFQPTIINYAARLIRVVQIALANGWT